MTLNRHKNYLLNATALLALMVVTSPSLAKEAPQAPVQEILVTAQKRIETLKSAPLSVSVISGQVYGQAGGRDLRDLQTLTSSLIITATANEAQTTARLRGVGTVGDNPGLDSSVGVVIDGVTRARTATAMSDLGEVERIEILKGPQSTLFGRNASAGLISVLTKAPTFTPGSEAELTLGDRGLKGGSVSVTGPLSDQIAGRLYVAKRERDGQYSIRTGAGPRTDREDGDTNYLTARGQLLFVPHDRARVRIIADYTRRDEACCTGVMITRGSTANWIDTLAPDEGVAPVANPGARVAWSNRSTRQKLVDMGLSAETTLEFDGGLKLTSLTAARFWDHNNGYDADFSTADIYYRNEDGSFGNRFETLSQELRLEGQAGALDWSAGVYLASERLERRDEYLYGKDYEPYIGLLLSGGSDAGRVSSLTGLASGQSFLSGLGSRDVYTQTSNTLAVFTQNSLALRQDLILTGGIRVTREDKTLTSDHVNTDQGRACSAAQARGSSGLGVLCLPWSNPAFNRLAYAQDQSETATSGTLKLAWTPVTDLMTYVSYSRGWKAGGVNLDREQTATFAADLDTRFGAETVDAYELGAKWRGFSGALAVDAALFHQAFKDFQLNTFLGTTFLVKSVPELTARGAEADVRWTTPVPGLSLLGSVTFTESQFGSDPVVGLPLVANSRAAFAPKWSGSVIARYQRSLGTDLKAGGQIAVRYNSAYNTGSDLLPSKIQPAYSLVNARLWLAGDADRWAVEAFADNLTDERYFQVAFNAPFQAGTLNAFLGQPRTVGVTLRLRR